MELHPLSLRVGTNIGALDLSQGSFKIFTRDQAFCASLRIFGHGEDVLVGFYNADWAGDPLDR